MSTKKITATTGSPLTKKKTPAQTQRTSKRTIEIVESDLDEPSPKKKPRFDWNGYPETRDFVDGSGVTSVAEKEGGEFLMMYHKACKVYKTEGGQDDLGKLHVKNRIQNLRHGKVKSSLYRHSPSLGEQSEDDESWDPKKRSYRSDSESPPSPKFRTLLPGEKIDFSSFQNGVTAGLTTLQDQCHRLMGSLEESRRANMAITAERDHYKEFWTAMNNYHTVMSRFQVSAPSFAGAPFPGQMDYSSPLSIPQLGAAPSPLIPQTGAPPFATSAYPVYSATAANLAAVDLKFQPHHQTAGAPPPAVHDGTTRDPAPSTPEPTGPAAAAKPQSPETPSKRTSMKSLESYFASARKTPFPLSVEPAEPAVPAIPKPSPPHETGNQFTEGNKERNPPPGIPSKYSVDLSSSTEDASLSPLENEEQGQEGQGQEGQGQEGHKVGDHQPDWLV